MAFKYAGDNFRHIGFHPGGGARCAGPAAGQIGLEIFRSKRQTGLYAVHHNAHIRAVGLAEDAYSEFVTKCIHSWSNNSLNVGKDLATQGVSSISTGLFAPRAATFRAITMRWSP